MKGQQDSNFEIDEEVKEAEERDEHMNKGYEQVTQWNVIPLWPKLCFTSALVSITSSCYMVMFFLDFCFVENLGENVANLFLPLGWESIGLFCAFIFLLDVFSR